MKKILKLMILSATLFAASCVQEIESNQKENSGDLKDVVLEVSMPERPMAKTILGEKVEDGYPVFWQEGDVISVNGVLSTAVTSDAAGNDSFAFNVRVSEMPDAPYNVLYPGVEGVEDKVVFKAEQEYQEGTFATNTLPMYGSTSTLSEGVTLDYLASVLRLPIRFTSSVTLSRITVAAPAGEALSGTFAMLKENDAFTGELEAETTSNTVSYVFSEQDATFEEGTAVFHIVVPKGTYEGGLEISFHDVDGNYMTAYAFTGENSEVAAGKVYEFAERTYFPTGIIFLISTPEDLQTFATKTGSKHAFLEARVVNDIDMTDVEYNSDEFNYYGTLDGGGFSITGLTTSLFNNLRGSVKNLKLTANVEYTTLGSDASDTEKNNPYGMGLLAHYVYPASEEEESEYEGQIVENVTVNGSLTISGITTTNDYKVGGIVGASNGIPFKGCVNNASVTIQNISAKNLRVGGVSGALQSSSSADMLECSNTGSITLTSNTASEDLSVAGLTGYSTQAVEINNGANSGKIAINGGTSANLYAAGIIGSSSHKNLKMDTVEQTADAGITISSSYTTATAYYIGGIVGSQSFSVSNAVNRAPISVSGTSTNGNMAIGGVIGRGQGALSNASNYGAIDATSDLKPTCPDGLYIGGVVGNANNSSTALSGTIYNEGNVTCAAVVSMGEVKTETTDEETGVTTTETTTTGGSLFLGGLVGDFTGGSSNAVSGQSNKGKVKVTASIPSDAYIGGAVGRNRKSISVSNYGSVTVENTNLTESVFVGGVAGYLEDAITLDGCTNNAAVSVSGTPNGNQFVGGVFGSKSGAKMSILNCVNNEAGSVSISGTTEIESYIMLAGVLAGCPGGSSTISGCKNYGTVTNDYTGGSSNSTAVTIGGVVGRLTDSALGTLTLCENHGAIINNCPSTASGSSIRLGGIIGYTHQVITNGLNENTNYGSLTNNATSGNIIVLGGVVAYNQSQNTISSCNNQGALLNTADAKSDISLGGIIGKSTSKTTTVTKCTNGVSGNATLGTVSNTGKSATSGPNTQIGGIVGFADVITNVNASGDDRSINYGPVSDISASLHPAVGGVVGYTNKASDFSNARNEGAVSISGNVTKAYLGGVVGYAKAYIKMNNASNSGNLSFSNSKVGNQIWVGGLVSIIEDEDKTEATYTGLTNSGVITVNSGITSSSTSYNYVGGIIGSSDGQNKTFADCINTGDINMRPSSGGIPLKCRVGGIAGIANKNPEGSKCFADIDFKTSVSNNSHIGGVAGYLNISEYSDLTYKGNINSNGSSGTNYTGGIVGCTNSGEKTFSSCVVSGTMRGANSGTGMAGVFCNSSAQADYTFDSCKVGSGTIHKAGDGGTANATTITSDDQLVVGVLVGGKGASSCTVTNCTVVDPDTITIE